jgi:hypothetical protein
MLCISGLKVLPCSILPTTAPPHHSNLFAHKADWGWMNNLEMDGWVPTNGRDAVAGV